MLCHENLIAPDFWHPSGMQHIFSAAFRWCRSPSLAQPPATIWQASGLQSAHTRSRPPTATPAHARPLQSKNSTRYSTPALSNISTNSSRNDFTR